MVSCTWVLLLAAALLYGATGNEQTEEVGLQRANPVTEGEANPVSADCPHGLLYWKQCNSCRCLGPGHLVGLCTRKGCGPWTCDSPVPNDRVQDENCYGQCTCDSDTYITTCEKRGCGKALQDHMQVGEEGEREEEVEH